MSKRRTVKPLLPPSGAGPAAGAGDGGVPPELVDRFEPGGPGWAISEAELLRFMEAIRSGRPLHDALGPDFGAWMRLHGVLGQAGALPEIAASPSVSEFVDTLMLLVMNGTLGGADRVFHELRAAAAGRAAQHARARGNATRQDVADAWRKLERDGKPLRERVQAISVDEGIPKSTVRDALRSLGLYEPKSRKRG